ncbi:metal ABC transporter substrate-binding protein [Brunnivagina elsteri]|uniref:Metal ABC transporter substrate-binding protein n=1 Tax=Brunnivagina elsteri CCALA 953 TaxID=987040 RepID=A0A2A2TDB3_9CYAN|nr:metal ABC transporter substrate-binding protein [Calothrix elsteri]PAX51740.1 metal ABC transporter substrate-binding protein [Calothrix elsteri CCALA 953]
MRLNINNFQVQIPQYGQKLAVTSGLLLGLCLGGCIPSTSESQSQLSPSPVTTTATNLEKKEKKVVLTTFTVLADIAQNVAGDKAIVESMTKPGAEIHGYEPTPSDLVRAQKADLILDNGLNLERWAQKLYNSVPNVPRITLTEGIQPVEIAENAYKGKPNPHAWMSPQNALIYVENIRKALINLDSGNADTYNTNAKAYSQKIKEVDEKLRKAVSVIPADKRYMVSCEGAFSYITRDYGLKEVYIWAVNSEQQATPKQVEKVIDTVKANKIPVVFCESTVNDGAQRQVAKESGARYGGVFYVDSLSPADGPAPTYLKLLERNVTTLTEGLLLK